MHAVKYENEVGKDQDQDNIAPAPGDEDEDQAAALESGPVNDHMGIETGNVSGDKEPEEALAAVIDDTWESLFENF